MKVSSRGICVLWWHIQLMSDLLVAVSHSDTHDFLDQKDGSRHLTWLKIVFAGARVDDRGVVLDSLLWRQLFLLGFLLKLHVEEPLVDLDAWKASLLHGFSAHLAVPFTTKFVEQRSEIVNLSCGLFTAAHLMLDHSCRCAFVWWDALFPFAFARDQNRFLHVDIIVINQVIYNRNKLFLVKRTWAAFVARRHHRYGEQIGYVVSVLLAVVSLLCYWLGFGRLRFNCTQNFLVIERANGCIFVDSTVHVQ